MQIDKNNLERFYCKNFLMGFLYLKNKINMYQKLQIFIDFIFLVKKYIVIFNLIKYEVYIILVYLKRLYMLVLVL